MGDALGALQGEEAGKSGYVSGCLVGRMRTWACVVLVACSDCISESLRLGCFVRTEPDLSVIIDDWTSFVLLIVQIWLEIVEVGRSK